jgi:pimeloyl-[acyl-carrier protein] methyl ester esterase
MTTLLAMHGWAGDSRGWAAFAAAAAAHGWTFGSPDRGYGARPPQQPGWPDTAGRRVLLAHSLGLHLLADAVLAAADAVVLLASFGRFVPEGPAGRRLRTALAGMASALDGTPQQATAMLEAFLERSCAPQPLEALPCSILDRPLPPAGLTRLRNDLRRLAGSTDLPAALQRRVPCLIVEAGKDRIVAPEAGAMLRQTLPQADRLVVGGAGHALLASPVVPMVMGWIEALDPA